MDENLGKRYRRSWIVWVLLALIATFFLWAWRYSLDQVVRGQGVVISSSRLQLIQAVDGGILSELKVKEGDHVEAGQVLALLDTTRFQASKREIDARLTAMYAQAARLRAELANQNTIVFPDSVVGHKDIVAAERALFIQRRTGFLEETESLSEAVRLAQEDYMLVKKLADHGDVSRSELIRAQRAVNEVKAMLTNKTNAYYADIHGQLVKTLDQIAQDQQVLEQRTQVLDSARIVTPVRGIVKNVRVTTIGGVLHSGEELMEIVPLDEKLIIEAKVNPADIALLRIGLPVNIRFDAYDYTIYGAVDGKISFISADATSEAKMTGQLSYYIVQVVPESYPATSTTGKELLLIPGMSAQVSIKTAHRTVLQYLFKPVIKTLTESMEEK